MFIAFVIFAVLCLIAQAFAYAHYELNAQSYLDARNARYEEMRKNTTAPVN